MPTQPSRKPSYLDRPYTAGDSIPAPLVVERDGESAWQMFNDLQQQQERRFAQTEPASLSTLQQVDRGYAPTAPMGLPTATDDAPPPRAAPVAPRMTLDAAMVEARRNNRVCPRPEHWLKIYELLPNRKLVQGKHQPAPPITGAAWHATPSLPKRLCFREHLEWAERHGALDVIVAHMKLLPEGAWLHMGDD